MDKSGAQGAQVEREGGGGGATGADCLLPLGTSRTLAYGLVVERHQLAAGVPEELRHKVGRVDSGAFRVDTTQLGFVISGSRRVKNKRWGAERHFEWRAKET